jgi:hypothetical protein
MRWVQVLETTSYRIAGKGCAQKSQSGQTLSRTLCKQELHALSCPFFIKKGSTDSCILEQIKMCLLTSWRWLRIPNFQSPRQLTLKQLWHYTPASDDKIQQDPNQSDKVGAFHDRSWYCEVWHLGAWYHVNDNNLVPTKIPREIKDHHVECNIKEIERLEFLRCQLQTKYRCTQGGSLFARVRSQHKVNIKVSLGWLHTT